ncbi:MAG: crossover junction endodeoxyribonuclease RuvC [Anaerolineales bacterium]|nr:crossover junction endodeoxyribonuclease RuvC [Anaerolineales bacterium]
MLVIGIDPGTALTGFGLVRRKRDASLELVEYGVIRTSARQPMARRLVKIHTELVSLLERFQPTEAAVERLFFQKNVTTAISVGQARGVVMLALASVGLTIEEYTPQDIKLAVTGYGAADKGQMQRMVKTLLTMDEIPKPDDAADALAVAICHAHNAALCARLEGAQ